ncbi:MAG: hypothetical protein NDJ94_19490 [Vicinamibacteria bacterium]|nr:hypothetical protein [Vicinamibacteria bacterium]
MDDRCPECGEPMERADDFWYCDNPQCPRRRRANDDPNARPERKPEPKAGK